MKKFLFVLMTCFLLFSALAQDTSTTRNIILVATIVDIQQQKIEGYLHSISDSGIYLSMAKLPIYSVVPIGAGLHRIDPGMLSIVKVKKQRSVSKGMLIGAITGVFIGGIFGLATYQDQGVDQLFNYGQGASVLAGATLGLLGGTIAGGITSASVTKKFHINGSKEKYMQMQQRMRKRLVKRNSGTPL